MLSAIRTYGTTLIVLALFGISAGTWIAVSEAKQEITASAQQLLDAANLMIPRSAVPMSYSKVVVKNPQGEVVGTYTTVTNYVVHDTNVTFHGHQEGGESGQQDFTVFTGPGWTIQCFE